MQKKTKNNKGSENTVSETEEETSQTPDEEQKPATTGATYFFRTIGRKEYSQTKDEDLTKELENFIKNINRSMIEVNFRREPIYLSRKPTWTAPEYIQYRFAIARMPSLKDPERVNLSAE